MGDQDLVNCFLRPQSAELQLELSTYDVSRPLSERPRVGATRCGTIGKHERRRRAFSVLEFSAIK